jgi:hypothetical protein
MGKSIGKEKITMSNEARRIGGSISTKREQPNTLLAILTLLAGIFGWFTGFFRLTDEEQRDAGIYLGDQRSK